MSDRPYSKDWFAARLADVSKGQADLYHFMNERFGLDRTKVSKMVNGLRRPQPNELPAMMEWLGLTLDGTKKGGAPTTGADFPVSRYADALTIGEESDFPRNGPRNVPVRQIVTGGDEGEFIFSDNTMDYLRRPPNLVGQRVFGAYVTGDSMEPKYESGEPIYAYIARPAFPGDYVVVELRPKQEAGESRGFIKRLVKRTSKSVVCEQFNPKKIVEYPADEVLNVYRVVPTAELFG